MPNDREPPNALSPEDEQAISAVLIAYATGIDRRDWALFERCFTPDCLAEYGAFGTWRSAREITDFMREAHAPLGTTLHRITNIALALCPQGAAARCYVDALLLPAEAGGTIHRGIGSYDDILVHHDGAWRIAHRTFHGAVID